MHSLLSQHVSRYVNLTEEEYALFESSLKLRRLKKKQFLLIEGDVARFETFVLKGCLKAYYIDQEGQEHIAQFAVEEWWIGDLHSFLTQMPALLNIEVLEDSEVLTLEKDMLEELYLKIPPLERYFRILIQNAFIASQKRIIASMSQTADERYLDFLKRYPNIEQRIPQYMVASYLGITPEFLSKIRRKFAGK